MSGLIAGEQQALDDAVQAAGRDRRHAVAPRGVTLGAASPHLGAASPPAWRRCLAFGAIAGSLEPGQVCSSTLLTEAAASSASSSSRPGVSVGPSSCRRSAPAPTCVSGSALSNTARPTSQTVRRWLAPRRPPHLWSCADRARRSPSTGTLTTPSPWVASSSYVCVILFLERFLRASALDARRRACRQLISRAATSARRRVMASGRSASISSSVRSATSRRAASSASPRPVSPSGVGGGSARTLASSASAFRALGSTEACLASPPAVSAAWRALSIVTPAAWVMNSVSPSRRLQHAHDLQARQLQDRQQRDHHLVAQLLLGQRRGRSSARTGTSPCRSSSRSRSWSDARRRSTRDRPPRRGSSWSRPPSRGCCPNASISFQTDCSASGLGPPSSAESASPRPKTLRPSMGRPPSFSAASLYF